MRVLTGMALGIACLATMPASAEEAAREETARATTAPEAVDYRDGAAWLCRPARDDDACAIDLDASVVAADGTVTVEPFNPAEDPAVDCFYVYPTVSNDPTGNSDMVANDEERAVIAAQFARFGSVCRTFAPLYRQVTLTALRARFAGQETDADRTLAYGDVRAAFKDYLDHDNDGRPFVLIGHSQGAGVLNQLIKNEIDGKPVQKRMLSAMLLGANVAVPPGADTGGDFKSIPLCRSAGQTGCVVSYVSFRSDSPPPATSFFGRVPQQPGLAACTNPADLAGEADDVPLDAYLSTGGAGQSSGPQAPWVADGPEITTPSVKVPELLTGHCVSDDTFTYLRVTVNADPEDPRTDYISGDVVVDGQILHDWGLHLIDVRLAQGDLIDLVKTQAAAMKAAN